MISGFKKISRAEIEIHQGCRYNLPDGAPDQYHDRFIVTAEISFADGARLTWQSQMVEETLLATTLEQAKSLFRPGPTIKKHEA